MHDRRQPYDSVEAMPQPGDRNHSVWLQEHTSASMHRIGLEGLALVLPAQ